MRLLGFLPFLIIGMLVGLLSTKLFNRSPITAVANCVLGVFAAIVGLFFRDILDFESGLLSGLVTALIASVGLVFLANIIGPIVLAADNDTTE